MTDKSLPSAPADPRRGTQAADAGRRSARSPRPKRAGKPPRPTPRPRQKEFQGPKGPEPTRYGDWEHKGIASDF